MSRGATSGFAALAALIAGCLPAMGETQATPDAVGATVQWIDTALNAVARAMEVAGIAAIAIGSLLATFKYLKAQAAGWQAAGSQDSGSYPLYRRGLGRSILLGLEFLVAADIIGTVAVEPTLENLAVLSGIILIRTFLSFSLEVEIEGQWPWQKAAHK